MGHSKQKPISHTNQVKNEPQVVDKSVSSDGKIIRLTMSDSPYQVYKDNKYEGSYRYYHNSKPSKWAKKKAKKATKKNSVAASKRLKRFIDHKLSKRLASSEFDFTAHFYVYVILCSDEHYYVGTTTNVARRFSEHKNGKHGASFTKRHKPIKIVSVDDLGIVSYRDAIIAENEKTIEVMSEHPGKTTGGIAAECGWIK